MMNAVLESQKKTDEDSLFSGRELPGYRFIRELGHGSQGRIFLAERLSDNVKVAIKQLNIESVKNWKEYDLFHREADILESLNINGVARFYEAVERLEDNPPRSYIVQEYIKGNSLNDMLKAGHRFSLHRVFDIVLQMLQILKQLHSHNPPVIHRDIKPSNIMMKPREGDDYEVYLIDFGAVANPQVQGGGSTVAGTFGYMPPEQLMGNPEPASDIYALGAVIVYMLSGKSPAEMPNKDFRLIFEPDLQNMMPAVVAVLRQMFEPKIEKRLCNIDKLISIFKRFACDDYSFGASPVRSSSQLSQNLKKFSCWNEPGCVELWQQLPDSVPRKCPSAYYEHEIALPEIGEEINTSSAWSSIALYLFGSPCVFLIFFLIFSHALGVNQVSILFSLVFTLIFVCKFFVNKSAKSRFSTSQVQRKTDVLDIIENGVKTIATIVAIEYESGDAVSYTPAWGKFKKRYYEVYSSAHENDSSCLCYYRKYPVFKVSYKFNPPDDSNPDDLVCSFKTHIDPEGHYQVGDPLPILYYVNKIGGEWESVSSIPFPFPLDDLVFWEDMIDSTEETNIRFMNKSKKQIST